MLKIDIVSQIEYNKKKWTIMSRIFHQVGFHYYNVKMNGNRLMRKGIDIKTIFIITI